MYRSVVAKSDHTERKLRGLEHNMARRAGMVKWTRYFDLYDCIVEA
jgi:hypothetical protein